MRRISTAADGVERAAVVFGIPGPAATLDVEDLDALAPISDAPRHAKELASALEAFGYPAAVDDVEPASTDEFEDRIEEALARPGILVVHVAGHGLPGNQETVLYVQGPDRRTRLPVNQWLTFAEDGDARAVLFILDLCHAGAPIRDQILRLVRVESQRAWVLAAAGSGDLAFDLRLTRAVVEVLDGFRSGRLQVDERVKHIPLHRFCAEVDRAVRRLSAGRPEQLIESSYVPMHLDDDGQGLFPNPHWDVDRHNSWARTDPELAALLDEALDPAHFLARASGAQSVFPGNDRSFFHGRTPQLCELRDWASGLGGSLRVVTGKPGVGKSSLLGVFVCAAHPDLRDRVPALWSRLDIAARPPRMPSGQFAVVHARQRSTASICASLARQWRLTTADDSEWTGERLIEELRRARSGRAGSFYGVVDAVDEASQPGDLAITVLLGLAKARDEQGLPLGRLLVGLRPQSRFRPLIEAAGDDGLIDLARIPSVEVRPALRAYVTDLLTSSPAYDSVVQLAVVDAIAEGIATALLDGADHSDPSPSEWGEFLVAGLYVRHVLDQDVITDIDEGRARGLAAPAELRAVLDLDLGADPDELLLPVAMALAFAEGEGMPESVVRFAAAAVIDCRSAGLSQVPDVEQIRRVLARLRFYLRTDVDADGSTLYRLFHQGLADQLASDARQGRPTGTLERRLWERLHQALIRGDL